MVGALLKPGAISNIVNSEQFQNAKVALESTFEFLTKNMKGVLAIAGAIVGLKLAATLVAILKVGAGIIAILANPLLIAGVGILVAAGMQGLGKDEKEVMAELEAMGGYSEENRRLLIQRLQEQKESVGGPDWWDPQGIKGEIDRRIKFLETGDYSQNGVEKFFDWSKVEGIDQLEGFEKFMLNFETDTTNMNNTKDLVKDGSNNKITMIDVPGETIDMRNNKKQFIETPSDSSATNVAYVNPANQNNKYMNESPIVLGFNDSIYS